MMTVRMYKQIFVGVSCALVTILVALYSGENSEWISRSLFSSWSTLVDVKTTLRFEDGNRRRIVPDFNQSLYGVEMDLLSNMSYWQDPPFTFLKNYKNPCWLEHLTQSAFEEFQNTAFRSFAEKETAELDKIYKKRLAEDEKPWRLRCLPYVYLLGVTKGGTTDLFHVLTKHQPNVHGPWVKEPMYWNWRRYPDWVVVQRDKAIPHMRIDKYVNLFDHVAHIINQTGPADDHIIVDGSSYVFWEDNGWSSHPENKGLTEPMYTTPMALHAAQPHAKLIVMFRNPTDRIYSNYIMHTDKDIRTPEHFESLVTPAVRQYDDCFSRHTARACTYNVSLSQNTFPITLRASMYVIHLVDWLEVFPEEQLLVIRSEDYYDNRMDTLKDIFTFLDLENVDEKTANAILAKGPSMKRSYDPMLPSTRQMLDRLYKPFNKHLENVLQRQFWS